MDIVIPPRRIGILAECDLLVCGGGPAGIAAAVSAARHRARVVLVERWPYVGGMATAGLVVWWHRSDREKVVINGLVEEAAQRAQRHGWLHRVRDFPKNQATHRFEAEGMKDVFHDMLDEAGVQTLCYTQAGEPILEDGRIAGVRLSLKTGEKAIKAAYVIDATGDGDIMAKAGVSFRYGRSSDGLVQGMTLMFSLKGIDEKQRDAVPVPQREALFREMCRLSDCGKLPPFKRKINLVEIHNHVLVNLCPVTGNALDEEDLTRKTVKAKKQIRAYLSFLRENVPGFKRAEPGEIADCLGVRESRRLEGLKTLTSRMVTEARKQYDAVGHGVWMIDIHDPLGTGRTTWMDWREEDMPPAGCSYHIPLGMCLNRQVPNLLTAGRCASSTHRGHASVRVQTHCMVMGQGAGTAAALALGNGVLPERLELKSLQAVLRRSGVYLADVPD